MRLEWLEDILAVEETGSFIEAADRRRLTQSAFSRRIRNIEDYIGVELFDRTRKPVQLRPTTAAQREQITRLTLSLRQLVVDLRRGDRMAQNKIVIASPHALSAALTPSMIEGIRFRGEDIFVKLRSANLDECYGLLLARQADIAIGYHLPGLSQPMGNDYLETITIGQDELIPVIAKTAMDRFDDRLDAGDIPYIAYPPDVFFGQVMERMILPRILHLSRPVPKAETALTLAAIEMAAIGVAVAWVPRSLAQERLASDRLVDLSGRLPHCGLEVNASRLQGSHEPVEIAFWSRLQIVRDGLIQND